MHTPRANRSIAIIGGILDVFDTSVRECRVNDKGLICPRRLNIKAHSIDQRQEPRTGAGKINSGILIRYLRDIGVVPDNAGIIDRNSGEFQFLLSRNFSRTRSSLPDGIDFITISIQVACLGRI